MFDKFIFGNKQIPEMYFGNIPVAQIYFGDTLVWEKASDVPYDNTCIAAITLSQDKTAWIVTVTKDGENVTSSLSQITTWIYDGTGERVRPYTVDTNIIDLSQKPRGDYRVDLAQITSKAGGYFPGTGSISVPEHIYIGNLTAGDICVAIEYVPTNDITVDSLEIFSHETTSYTTSRIQIIHESGLYVGSFNGNGQDSIETRYSLEGRARTLNNVGTTLYKDEKYYIIFQDKDSSKYNTGHEVFKPAYFSNEEGNYKANVYDNTDATTLHPYSNVKNIKEFLPSGGTSITETDLQSILKLDTDELFLWNGNNLTVNSTDLIRDDHLGKKLTEKVTNPPITTSDADIWSYANQQIFVRHDYGSNVVDRIWKKKETTTNNGTFGIVAGSPANQHAQILLALGNDTTHKVLNSAPDHVWTNYVNQLVNLKSGYIVDSTLTLTPLNYLPTGIDKHFYYIEGGYNIWGDYNHTTSIYVYENGQFNYINAYGNDDMKNYLDFTTLETTIEQISLTTLVQEDQQVSCNTDVRDAAVSSGRKYYLRINGKEV